MWSFGCIITEFVTGTPVFPGESEAEQLQIHMEMLGVPPAHVILRGSRSNLFFDRKLQPILTTSKVPGSKDLSDLVEDAELCDLVAKCLNWDAKKRLSPTEGLSHPWLCSQRNLAIE
jgi:serine/threonine protein kinase